MSNEFDIELHVKHFHVIHVKMVLDGFDIEIPCEMCFEHLLTWKFHVKFSRGSGRACRRFRTRMPQSADSRAEGRESGVGCAGCVAGWAVLAVLAAWAVRAVWAVLAAVCD